MLKTVGEKSVMNIKKFLSKNYNVIALCLFVLCNVCGVIGFYLIDEETAFRPELWQDNWYSELIKSISVPRIDISFAMGGAWLLSYIGLLQFAIAVVFCRTAAAIAEKKGVERKKFYKIHFPVSGGIFVLLFLIVIIMFVTSFGGLRDFILLYGYFFLLIVLFLLAVLVVFLLLTVIIGIIKTQTRNAGGGVSLAGGGAASPVQSTGDAVFPGLKEIDDKFSSMRQPAIPQQAPCTLYELALGFQAFLSEKCSLYYDLSLIRSFLAGMATSRLIILEGLSGTGKSSLPRYFAEYVGSRAFFAPVQATWRDRSDVLGFYNDFSGVFKETPFLKKLYEASYTPAKFNVMVLDEMNISRIEYYFADFLSIMEYPIEDWKVNLTSHVPQYGAPLKLSGESVVIPFNTWFIGTANRDDSTFTITDKVYDRAIVLEFAERNAKVPAAASPEPVSIAPTQLYGLFVNACRDNVNRLTVSDMNKFLQITQFVYETFDVMFGNRIMNQIYIFVPVYVALGGTKEEALDIMFSGKILHKLEGRFDDYMKDGLLRLQSLITQVYGPGVMVTTERMIRRLLRKLM